MIVLLRVAWTTATLRRRAPGASPRSATCGRNFSGQEQRADDGELQHVEALVDEQGDRLPRVRRQRRPAPVLGPEAVRVALGRPLLRRQEAPPDHVPERRAEAVAVGQPVEDEQRRESGDGAPPRRRVGEEDRDERDAVAEHVPGARERAVELRRRLPAVREDEVPDHVAGEQPQRDHAARLLRLPRSITRSSASTILTRWWHASALRQHTTPRRSTRLWRATSGCQ